MYVWVLWLSYFILVWYLWVERYGALLSWNLKDHLGRSGMLSSYRTCCELTFQAVQLLGCIKACWNTDLQHLASTPLFQKLYAFLKWPKFLIKRKKRKKKWKDGLSLLFQKLYKIKILVSFRPVKKKKKALQKLFLKKMLWMFSSCV